MAQVIIFGVHDFAQLAHFYISRESEHEVVAFTMNSDYINESSFAGLPVVEFEKIQSLYPPDAYRIFIPMSPAKMNVVRAAKYREAKGMGYSFVTYISPKSTYYGTPVGENCFIFENNVIQPFTEIGDDVILWSGNHIGHHSRIGNHVFIASHAVISGHVTIEEGCFIGVNATIRDGVRIAPRTFVGAGGLILDDTEENGVYPGTASEKSRVPSNRLKI